MITSKKFKVLLIVFFVAIFAIIAARHFIGLHFQKKFSVRPAPAVIVKQVERSSFFKSIETFGTAIAKNTKSYRIKTVDIVGKLNIENRFVKKGEIILKLQDGSNIVADFEGKLGKREIAQGVLMTVKIIYDETDEVGVPESAVTIQGDTAFVYVVNNEMAEKKNIKIGKRNFGKVSVLSGIDEGDFVISEGVSKVRNKAKVKIINP